MSWVAIISALVLIGCPPELPSPVAPQEVVTSIDTSEFIPFCIRESKHPACRNIPGRRPTLDDVNHADQALRSVFTYRTDLAVHNKSDYWTSRDVCGDCEDYALRLASDLTHDGFASKSMVLMLWAVTPYLAHASLLVNTSDAGWVEIGVLDPPFKFDPSLGKRMLVIPFDGSRTILKATEWEAKALGPLPSQPSQHAR